MKNAVDRIHRIFGIKKGRRIKKKIKESAENKKVTRIRYQKKGGKTKTYDIEPYSYRKNKKRKYLFGLDREAGKIKQFLLKNIKSADIKDKSFDPRYPVEIGKAAGFASEIQKHAMKSINPLISVSKGPAKHTSSIFGPQSRDRMKMMPGGIRSTGKAHKGLKNFLKKKQKITNKLMVSVPKIPQ